MQIPEFQRLCRDASFGLGVADTAALGQGFTVTLDGVPLEALFRDGSDSFVLLAELGTMPQHNRQAVYENLFTMQLVTCPALRFGFNRQRRTVVACIHAPLGPGNGAAWLAKLLHGTAKEAARMRKTLLGGEPGFPLAQMKQLEDKLFSVVEHLQPGHAITAAEQP
jgi:hypothetical protein